MNIDLEEQWYGVFGTVFYEGSKEELTEILKAQGIKVSLGHWALRFPEYDENYELGYEGNLSKERPFVVNAEGENLSTLIKITEDIGKALKKAKIDFEFTIHDYENDIKEIKI